MTKTAVCLVSLAIAVPMAFGAEKKVKLADLPPAVRSAVAEAAKGAEIKGISKEVEKGKTVYEIETVANGKTRDLTLDAAGTVVSVEQEVTLESIPPAAKAAIEKQAAGGKIEKVESVTQGGQVQYEARIAKGLRKREVTVGADGSAKK